MRKKIKKGLYRNNISVTFIKSNDSQEDINRSTAVNMLYQIIQVFNIRSENMGCLFIQKKKKKKIKKN